MDGEHANVKGRATAFSTLTPLKSVFHRLRSSVLFALLRVADPREDALQLAFLHDARWIVLPRRLLARHVRGRERPPLHDELLFISTFNGDRREYLSAFSRVLTDVMNQVWSGSVGWPGAEQHARFNRYVDDHALGASVFFNGYGSSGVPDVRCALRVSDALERFALTFHAETFETDYSQLLYELSPDLGN